jgi:hypothetical protein
LVYIDMVISNQVGPVFTGNFPSTYCSAYKHRETGKPAVYG